LTGQTDQDIGLNAIRAGAADHLVKDQIDAPLLERSIRHALERFRFLETLRASEALYRDTLEVMSEGIAVLDSAGRVLIANATARRILGPLSDPEWADLRLEDASADGTRLNATLTVCQENGEPFQIPVHARPVQRSEESSPHAFVVRFTDPTTALED
jgi:PAS domain-containing protein